MKASFSKTWLERLAPTLLTLFLLPSLHAADEADPSIKLREQLRATLLQLRAAQTEKANLQATHGQAEAKAAALTTENETLQKRADALAKQATADKTDSEKTIATLNNKLAEREKRIAEYQAALEKWKAGYEKAAATAQAKESERAKLAAETIVLKRVVADRESRNLALFSTANEILDRYQNYALGKALTAREPFIGTTRVKIENLVQGYQDKILENRLPATTPKP